MSSRPHKTFLRHAGLFAALGDETRLSIVERLASGESCSITALTQGAQVTRQAITKHLRVLEDAGVVKRERRGRETVYQLTPDPLEEAKQALEQVSHQWDQALARLKAFVER